MDKKERDVQNALGQMREFEVTITVPVTGTVTIRKRVMAVSEESAIETVNDVMDITPEQTKTAEVNHAVHSSYPRTIVEDTAKKRTLVAHALDVPKDIQWATAVGNIPNTTVTHTSGYLQVVNPPMSDAPDQTVEKPNYGFLTSDDESKACGGGG